MVHHAQAADRIRRECACLRIRKASRLVTKIYDAHLRRTGLQESQVSLLVAIALFGEKGASMTALAEALAMDRTTLTRNLKPLEKADLLRVARSPHDARVRVVLLTRAGERTIQETLPLWERAQAEMRKALGPALFTRLCADLERIDALMSA
jgi:DNA-binding MarR family transcriptional regulator